MLILRATVRLAKLLKTPQAVDPPASQTLLGDWYANVLVEGNFRMVICINELTRYAIPIQLRGKADCDDLYNQLQMRIHRAVRQSEAPDSKAQADRVAQEYAGGMVIAKTASRSLLGTLNDFIYLAPGYFDVSTHDRGGIDWHQVEALLNGVPHGSCRYQTGQQLLTQWLRNA